MGSASYCLYTSPLCPYHICLLHPHLQSDGTQKPHFCHGHIPTNMNSAPYFCFVYNTRTSGAYGPLVLEYGDCFFCCCLFCLLVLSVFFFFFFFFAAILDFTDVKNVTEGRRREGDQARFFLCGLISFHRYFVLCCNRVQCPVSSVQCPVSRCPGSPSSETHRPFFRVVQPCEDDSV